MRQQSNPAGHTHQPDAQAGPHNHKSSTQASLMLGALGVVYGDIGTSPLYAFKQSVEAAGGVSGVNVLAILSLMIW